MANSIAKFKKYTDLLDEVYKAASKTANLDINGSLVQAGANANEIIIPKISMDGLADYSRSSGYVSGDVTLTNETVQFNYERGRKFQVDAMDNEETAGVAFGKLSSEFIRAKAAPELDAFRFAKYAGTSGISTTTAAALSSGTDVLSALVAATNALDEAEVPADDRVLYITPTLHTASLNVDTTKSKDILGRFGTIIDVPQTRFYTAIDLYDGSTTGETGGGFVKGTDHYELTTSQPADWSTNYTSYYTESSGTYTAVTGASAPEWAASTYYKKTASAGKNINFMLIHKPAVIQFSKHVVNKIFSPDENQNADAWIFNYRSYGLADVYGNKAAGIYLHKSTT